LGATSWFDLEARVAFRLAKRSWLVTSVRLRRGTEMGMGEAIWVGMVKIYAGKINTAGGKVLSSNVRWWKVPKG